MPINVAEMTLAQNPRRRVLRLRPIHPTGAQAARLLRVYRRVVSIWTQAAKAAASRYAGTVEGIEDAVQFQDRGAWVKAVLSFAEAAAEAFIATEAEALFSAWADDMVQWHTKRIVQNLSYAGDIDVNTSLLTPQGETAGDAVRYNVSLISDLSDQMRGRIEETVLRGYNQRLSAPDIAKELRHITGMGAARARRIAGDQVVKISSQLDRERSRELGFETFRWQHSAKRHPRPEHKARNGLIFRYDDPDLKGDMPGDLPNCGCVAIPTMELTE